MAARTSLAALALSLGALLSPPRTAAETAAPIPEPAPTPSLAEFGRIDASVRQVRRPNCWKLALRGDLTNPYDVPVEGVRIILRLRGEGEHPREMERLEAKFAMGIPPGKSVRFDREFTTPCTSGFYDITIIAFALRRGGAELPLPEQEVEAAAAERNEAFSSAGVASGLNSGGTFTSDFSGR